MSYCFGSQNLRNGHHSNSEYLRQHYNYCTNVTLTLKFHCNKIIESYFIHSLGNSGRQTYHSHMLVNQQRIVALS